MTFPGTVNPKYRHRIRITLSLLAVALAAGCGKNEDNKDNKKAAATQVAAKVNSTEITIHQVNGVLARTPNVAPEVADKAKREILDKLIDQQVLRQEAVQKKVDRTPAVVQALEAAKTEILARAYLEQIAAAQPKPSPAEVKKYYAEHAELFAERRVFQIEEIGVAPNPDIAAALAEQVAKARSMQEIAAWLKSRDAKFTANRGVRAAEQIPLELLPKFQTMKNGEVRIFEAAGGARQIVRLVASKNVPADEAAAAPLIERFLLNRRATEAIAKEMKDLKAKAKIEYAGEFASAAAAAEAKAKAEAAAKARGVAEMKAKADAEAKALAEEVAKAREAAGKQARQDAEAKARATASKPAQLPQQNIEKGVSGIR